MDDEAKRNKQLTLAHQLLRVIQSDDWKNIMIPYFQGERDVLIEMMASMTDPLQLMRYAGSVQTIAHAVIGLEARARQVIDQVTEKNLKKYQ